MGLSHEERPRCTWKRERERERNKWKASLTSVIQVHWWCELLEWTVLATLKRRERWKWCEMKRHRVDSSDETLNLVNRALCTSSGAFDNTPSFLWQCIVYHNQSEKGEREKKDRKTEGTAKTSLFYASPWFTWAIVVDVTIISQLSQWLTSFRKYK